MTDHSSQSLLVSVPEAARILGIGRSLVWDLIYKNELPVVRLGRRVLVPRSGIEQIITTRLGSGQQ